MQALILSFDSLAANSLGCYGNEWIETSHWDRLAATGVVFDHHFTDTVGSSAGAAWANGHHVLRADSPSPLSLGQRLRGAGVSTKLIVAGAAQDWHRSADFDDLSSVTGNEGFDARPDEVPIAQLVKTGMKAWTERSDSTQPRLLWLHAPGPGIPPEGFDSLYDEEFEERGQILSELSLEHRLNHPAMYAGAVSLIDYWLGELLTQLESTQASQSTLLIVMAAQGHLWHQIVPRQSDDTLQMTEILNDQVIRSPLVIRILGDDRFQEYRCIRCDRLVQTCDLVPTVEEWFGIETAKDPHRLAGSSWLREIDGTEAPRTALWIDSDEDLQAVRTTDWLCIRQTLDSVDTPPAARQAALFRKPDDIWDVNDVASQHPDVIDGFLGHHD